LRTVPKRVATWGARTLATPVADLKKTLIYDEHVAAGGTMVDFTGYSLPVTYKGDSELIAGAASIIDSTKWTRTEASLFDVSHMCSIRCSGKDAAAFLEHVTVCDVEGLAVNQGTLSVITTESGGVIDDTMITKCDDHIYQVINAGCADKDLAHFDEQLGLFGGEVNMDVQWDNRGLFALQGPKAKDVMQRLIGNQLDLATVGFGQCFTANVADVPVFFSRCGYTGEDGFELFVPGDDAVTVWKTLTAESEVRLAALGARDSLRLEAGLCLYGNELDENTSPVEAGLTWTIGQARRAEGAAPFLGSDHILAQVNDRTLVKKLRAGLLPQGAPARTGAIITSTEGEEIGVVTSGGRSPILGANIAIGYINKPFNRKGTDVQITVRGKTKPAVTTPMPFVPTSYYKV